jgi:RNAse (barnase) inhibitor barstar
MWADPLASLASGLMYADDTTDLAALGDNLAESGWLVARCNADATSDKSSLIEAIAQGLSFPEWTGRNLDALYDALKDLSWVDEHSVAVIVDRAAGVRNQPIDGWQQIREVLADAAAWWQAHDRTFVAVLR